MAIAVAEVRVAARKTERGIEMGLTLEAIRKERGFKQVQVAEALGMSLEGYRNYAKGYGRIRQEALPRWSRALDMPIPELAHRLSLDLLGEPDASGLREQITALLPDADAATTETLIREVALLPPADRREVLAGWRDTLAGRKAHLGRA
jgi:transcriptional regulator with XRE-family HTH domain